MLLTTQSTRPLWTVVTVCLLLAVTVIGLEQTARAETAGECSVSFVSDSQSRPIGSGDGMIHIIPAVSAPSVKNGGKLTVSAVVKAPAGVKEVVADLGGIETLTLKPSTIQGGVSSDTTVGLWSADWNAHSLEEKIYTIGVRVTDSNGHVFEDRSLNFSDPAAGLSTPGTTAYPNSSHTRIGAKALIPSEPQLSCSVIDAVNGYAYFGTATNPGVVVKVALGTGVATPTYIGEVKLNTGENNLGSAVIDTANGYAYFGTVTAPGIVVKIALGAGSAAPTRVAAVTLNIGEDNLACAVSDTTGGYAYFGTYTVPGSVVKVALSLGNAAPVRIGAVTLNAGEDNLACAVIDVVKSVAYFGTDTAPGIIAKVSLGVGGAPPTRLGILTLNAAENNPRCAIIDTATNFAWFGTATSPGFIVKIDLSGLLPTHASVAQLNPGENNLLSAVIDLTHVDVNSHHFAYFGTATSPGIVVKVDLGLGLSGAPGAAPVRSSALTLNAGENVLACAVIDPANTYAYVGTYTTPGRVVKVALGALSTSTPPPPTSTVAPTRQGALTLNAGEDAPACAVVDTANGYAYFGTAGTPGIVVKVALGVGVALPVRVGSVRLNTGEDNLACAVIDSTNGYAYFGTNTAPGIVVKIALGAGAALPTRLNAVTLNAGENNLACAVADAANGYAYFGTNTVPGIVVKLALGAGVAAPTRLNALTLNVGENSLQCAVIDTVGYVYFGTATAPGIVVKLALGAGATTPIRVGSVVLNAAESNLSCAVIDAANGYAYFGATGTPGFVVKVALGTSVSLPTRVGAATLNAGENSLRAAVLDLINGNAYFETDVGTAGSLGSIVRVSVGLGTVAPARLGTLGLNPGEITPYCAVIDAANGYAYFGAYTVPGTVVKVSLPQSQKGTLHATKMLLSENAIVTDMRFYSHTAGGSVRLALYDNALPKNLIWDSGSVPNTVTGGEIIVPISSGVPASLNLVPGIFWLVWEVNTTVVVGSYTAGTAGSGFSLAQPYGAYPATIGGGTAAADRWTQYITYNHPQFVITGSATQTAGVPQTITLTVTDSAHNILINYNGTKTLIFSGANSSANPVSDPTANGTTLGYASSVTFVSGVATVELVLFKTESALIYVTDGYITTATPLAVNVLTSTSKQLAFTTQPGNGAVGFTLITQPVVTIQDAFGNTSKLDNSNVTLAIGANPGGGVLDGTTTVAASNGVAVFSGLSINKVSTGYTLTATSGTLAETTSDIFNIDMLSVLSNPTTVPSVAIVGQGVLLSIVASGTGLTYTWNFGDGTTGSGASTAHIYSAPGIYTAKVTVTSAGGANTIKTVSVTVVPNPVPDVIFTSLGSPPGSGNPLPVALTQPVVGLLTLKTPPKTTYNKKTFKLKVAFTGTFTVPLNTSLDKKLIAVSVGGLGHVYQLPSRVSSQKTVTLRGKSVYGVGTASEESTLVLQAKSGNKDDSTQQIQVTATLYVTGATALLPVAVIFNGQIYIAP